LWPSSAGPSNGPINSGDAPLASILSADNPTRGTKAQHVENREQNCPPWSPAQGQQPSGAAYGRHHTLSRVGAGRAIGFTSRKVVGSSAG
jgi:hypothetical protein